MSARLVVSLSGPHACPLDALAALAAELDGRAVPLSWIVSPARLAAAPALTDWLRTRSAGGDALLLHGTDHVAGRSSRWPIGTAVLPAHETRLHLIAARAVLAHLDLTVAGFAPRGWLVPPGTLDVLRRNGFRLCVEQRGVRDLAAGQLLPGRKVGPGPLPWQHASTEPWWCRATILDTARTARRGRVIRLAVPAAGLTRPGITAAVLDAVDIAGHHGARPVTYPDLVATSARAAHPVPAHR